MEALKELARDDAGHSRRFDGWTDWEPIEELSDVEFAKLKAAKKAAPEGTSVEAILVWDVTYREADCEDDPDIVDSDNEVKVESETRRLIVFEWTLGGGDGTFDEGPLQGLPRMIKVKATKPL